MSPSLNPFEQRPKAIEARTATSSRKANWQGQRQPRQRDTAGRIFVIRREDESKWVFGYNTGSEVTSAEKRFPSSSPIPGHQFSYAFDDIGNCTTASVGGVFSGQGGGLSTTISYTPVVSNKYSSFATPGNLWITGEADPGVTVTVNGTTAWRNGAFFAKQIAVSNSSAPVWQQVTEWDSG
jgi:hypothetical protein